MPTRKAGRIQQSHTRACECGHKINLNVDSLSIPYCRPWREATLSKTQKTILNSCVYFFIGLGIFLFFFFIFLFIYFYFFYLLLFSVTCIYPIHFILLLKRIFITLSIPPHQFPFLYVSNFTSFIFPFPAPSIFTSIIITF